MAARLEKRLVENLVLRKVHLKDVRLDSLMDVLRASMRGQLKAHCLAPMKVLQKARQMALQKEHLKAAIHVMRSYG